MAGSSPLAWGLPLVFTLAVFAVWAAGMSAAQRILDALAREEAALAGCAPLLRRLAEPVPADAAEPEPAAESAPDEPEEQIRRLPVPMLRRRLEQVRHGVRLGAPAPAIAPVAAAEGPPLGSERALRVARDLALPLGIAGTLLSLVFALAGGDIAAPGRLAALGWGLTGAMAGIVASAALRVCQSAVQGREEALAESVDAALSAHFLEWLDESITSPEARLAATIQRQLNLQARALRDLLTEKLLDPVGRLAAGAESLAGHSAAWSEASRDLKMAHTGFLAIQKSAQEQHEAQVESLFQQYKGSLADFADEMDRRQAEHAAQAQRLYADLQRAQAELMTGLLGDLREQLAAAHEGQQEASRALLASALDQIGAAVEGRVAAIESQVAQALDGFRQALPGALQEGLTRAVQGAVDLVDLVRGQAGELAQAVAQASQNADRQTQVYERWMGRVEDWQTRLEHALDEGQTAQRAAQEGWQRQTAESLGRMDAALAHAADVSRATHSTLAGVVGQLGDQVRALEETMKALQAQMARLREPVAALDGTLSQAGAPLRDTAGALQQLNAAAETLTRALLASGLSEQQRVQRMQETTDTILARLAASAAQLQAIADRVGALAKQPPTSR